MSREEKMQLSLTGENSHTVKIPPGQGSFSIGSIGMNAKKFDVLVEPDLPIHWDCFNSFFTGSGKTNEHLYPYGDWPRFFYYWGNDTNFIAWSQKRAIEDFTWSPNAPISADFTASNIGRLIINAEASKIVLKLGAHRFFCIAGNLEQVELIETGKIDTLSFVPTVKQKELTPYQLPVFEALSDIDSLDIKVDPVGQPFDCECLLQFKNLTSLSLSGNMTNLHCLTELQNLESLAIRYAPNLEALPTLQSWEKLTSFIGWNIEESKGKLLRNELKQLGKVRELAYSSVSQLRKPIWFTTEYGIPFDAWTGKNAKIAIRTYKATVKKLKKAKTTQEVKEILTEFVGVFNDLPQIETTEREDIGEAVDQLRRVPTIEIDAETASQWFDAVRDY
ncbi:MAG TPA: hypothetical protein DCS93_33280 [Microscillaceae bacterium]|nr:hypothetical protein [Microscillaceae bacterium]